MRDFRLIPGDGSQHGLSGQAAAGQLPDRSGVRPLTPVELGARPGSQRSITVSAVSLVRRCYGSRRQRNFKCETGCERTRATGLIASLRRLRDLDAAARVEVDPPDHPCADRTLATGGAPSAQDRRQNHRARTMPLQPTLWWTASRLTDGREAWAPPVRANGTQGRIWPGRATAATSTGREKAWGAGTKMVE